MKRPIKFRGKRIDNGKFVFGDLQTYFRTDGKTKSFVIRTWERLDDWVAVAPDKSVTVAEYYERPIDPESVAQLVGYDANGREVYEGDTVIRYDDEEEFAECPENGKLCTVIFDTQVIPDLNDYYCLLKE